MFKRVLAVIKEIVGEWHTYANSLQRATQAKQILAKQKF